jgi:hypothetical protein
MSFFDGGTGTFLFSHDFRNFRITSPTTKKAVHGSLSNRTDSGKRAPSTFSLVPVLIVFAISVSTVLAGVLSTATPAVLQ